MNDYIIDNGVRVKQIKDTTPEHFSTCCGAMLFWDKLKVDVPITLRCPACGKPA